jgi:pre-60S factor REI1
MKVAEPDSAASPPTPPRSGSPSSKNGAASSTSRRRHAKVVTVEDESEEYDEDDTESEVEEAEISEFIPGQCLFCSEEFDDLDSSLDHMATSHGFNVPFQEFLAVDLETVVWYLHFVIHAYRECISCGTRRSTPEAAQQHMIAKGHCRFDITGDMEDFYEMPQEDNAVLEKTQHDTSGTVRLPSGKIISNRKYQEPPEPRKRQERSNPFLESITAGPADPPSPKKTAKASTKTPSDGNTNTDVASRRGQEGRGGQMVRSSEALLAAQLSRLVLAGDRAQIRLEARKRGKMERKNNKILQKHFKVDAGDSRAGRQFCC